MNVFDLELTIHFECPGHIGDAVYLIGSPNHWQKDGLLLGAVPAGQKELKVSLKDVPEGLLEFHLSRGGWDKVACGAAGVLTAPYTFLIKEAGVLSIVVAAWRDDFPLSTASEQVHLLSEHFFFPALNAYRKVWIYLPESYEHAPEQRYPVLYMHDGQHLFDEATAVGRKGPVEWQVDKVINQSADEAIVVAIAHGGEEKDRLHDYVVQPVEGMPHPAGKQYLQDIVQALKPFVDSQYRTLPDWKYTAMAGSSLGGLLSLYAGLMHTDQFACLGVFSPSLWLDQQQVDRMIEGLGTKEQQAAQSYYLYGGGLENRKIKDRAAVEMDKDIERLSKLMKEVLQTTVTVAINPVGKHGALYWQQAFPQFYAWWWQQMKKNL